MGCGARTWRWGSLGKLEPMAATGHVIEYAGEAVRSLSMEGRMTLCNMSIEAGARAGMIAPDRDYICLCEGQAICPREGEWERGDRILERLPTDEGAQLRQSEFTMDAAQLCALCYVGNESGNGGAGERAGAGDRKPGGSGTGMRTELALEYMGLEPGKRIEEIGNRSRVYWIVHQFADWRICARRRRWQRENG